MYIIKFSSDKVVLRPICRACALANDMQRDGCDDLTEAQSILHLRCCADRVAAKMDAWLGQLCFCWCLNKRRNSHEGPNYGGN